MPRSGELQCHAVRDRHNAWQADPSRGIGDRHSCPSLAGATADCDGAAPEDREYFDYINFDLDSRRLYLTHGSEVLVVNADTQDEVGRISGLKVSHGVAVVPEVRRGFISDGGQGNAIIFDLKTLKVVGEAKAEADADYIIYDPASRPVFTFNGDSHNATAIDPSPVNTVSTIDL